MEVRNAAASCSNVASSLLTGSIAPAKSSNALEAFSNFVLIVSDAVAAGAINPYACSASGATYTAGKPFHNPTIASIRASIVCPMDFSFPEAALTFSALISLLLQGNASGITNPSPDCGCSPMTHHFLLALEFTGHLCSRGFRNRRSRHSTPTPTSDVGTRRPCRPAHGCRRQASSPPIRTRLRVPYSGMAERAVDRALAATSSFSAND